jgi:hypothetical protein
MKVVHTLLLAALVGASACSSSTTPAVTTTEQFASRLQEKGSAWRSVDVPTAGDLTVQLVSVTQANAVMNIGIGTIAGTQCVLASSIDTAAYADAVAPQLTRNVAVGTYCVRIADIGNLTQIIDFTISIGKPL